MKKKNSNKVKSDHRFISEKYNGKRFSNTNNNKKRNR